MPSASRSWPAPPSIASPITATPWSLPARATVSADERRRQAQTGFRKGHKLILAEARNSFSPGPQAISVAHTNATMGGSDRPAIVSLPVGGIRRRQRDRAENVAVTHQGLADQHEYRE